MKKLDPTSLAADWSILPFRARPWGHLKERPPWEHVTSMELSKVVGKHLQTVSNWTMRGILPQPVANNSRLRGNKNYFRISAVRAWLEGKDESEIIKNWVKLDLQADELTDGQVNYLLHTLYKVSLQLS
jgi:hypothetical protein